MNWTESDIQALKAQEAKDLAIEFMRQLEAKERGPISPGEVQIKELDFQVRLREAEIEDQRARENHERKIRELELQIEQERTRCAEAESRANQVREVHAQIIERVSAANESLSTQLERTTREHNLKVEQLEATFTTRQEALTCQIEEQERQRDALRDEISTLTDLRSEALEVGQLQDEIERSKKEMRQQHAEMEEQVASAEFEKSKKIGDTRRAQELGLAELDAQHSRDILQRNRQAAEAILESLDMIPIAKPEWDCLQKELQSARERTEDEATEIRKQARDEFLREYNITRSEPLDVTDLFYREQAARSEISRLESRLEKLDAEVARMREHIEKEPQRIASAVEAARTQVQNYIEQAGKR